MMQNELLKNLRHNSLQSTSKLTKHFTYGELNNRMALCNDTIVHNLSMLALYLEFVRLCYGKPIRVTNGFRTSQHNKEVGGVPNSMHLLGKAVDICPVFVGSKEQFDKDFDSLLFHVCRSDMPPGAYIKSYKGTKNIIHIHFGERDESPLDLLPFVPFNKV